MPLDAAMDSTIRTAASSLAVPLHPGSAMAASISLDPSSARPTRRHRCRRTRRNAGAAAKAVQLGTWMSEVWT